MANDKVDLFLHELIGRQKFSYIDRPSDWLTMPPILSTEDKFAGLMAIKSDDTLNRVAIHCITLGGGNYTIDWGDGTITEYASNAVAEHQYTYANISSSTDSTRGYRQVMVLVYPAAGESMLRFDFSYKHTSAVQDQVGWLEVRLRCPSMKSYLHGAGGVFAQSNLLEYVNFKASDIIDNCEYMFRECSSLTKVEHFPCNATNFRYMFYNCGRLLEVPALDFSNATNYAMMFQGCTYIKSPPATLDFSGVTGTYGSSTNGCANMFRDCTALDTWITLDAGTQTTNVINMQSMFYGCTAMTSAPDLDTTSLEDMQSMFRYTNITDAGNYNLSAVKSMANTYSDCRKMVTANGLTGGSNCTSFTFTFAYCNVLTNITSPLTTSGSINFYFTFRECYALTETPHFDLSASTYVGLPNVNTGYMFYNCTGLTTVWSGFDFSNVTQGYYTFSNCTAITTLHDFDLTKGISMQGFVNNCQSLTTAPTVIRTGAGVTNIDGFFYNCDLTTGPKFAALSPLGISGKDLFRYNTNMTSIHADWAGVKITNADSMFEDCYNLATIPAIDFSVNTTATEMFRDCFALTSLPVIDCTLVGTATNMFYTTTTLESLGGLTNMTRGFSLLNNIGLDATELNTIFTSLGTAAGAQTITVTGCGGAATCDTSIATAKGWTVVT